MDELVDACPSCLARSVPPDGTYQSTADGRVHTYRCHVCGHFWATSWGALTREGADA